MELLVVIAIITILAALLLPALRNARGRGKDAVCQSNLKQFSSAVFMYSKDWDGFFPMTVNCACSCPVTIHSYLGITDLCGPDWNHQKIWDNTVFRCPGEILDGSACPGSGGPPCWGRYYSYGIGYQSRAGYWHGHISLVDEPARLVSYACATTWRVLPRGNAAGDGWERFDGYHSAFDRHRGTHVSSGFLDGHAALVKWPEDVQTQDDVSNVGPPYDEELLITTR